MGKKWDKGKERVLSSSTLQDNVDDGIPPSEPWTCTGQFQQDFYELARRTDMTVIPPVLLRPHRPSSATSVATTKAAQSNKEPKAPKAGKGGPPPTAAPVASQLSVAATTAGDEDGRSDDDGRSLEAPPKTYITKDFFDYFKPKIQIELDSPDSPESCMEIFTRGFKVDAAIVAIFKQTFPTLEKLHTVNLWNSGLTKDMIDAFASFLPKCPRLKNLILDGNTVKEENFNVLINEESTLEKLSIRHCDLSDDGAAKLGAALGGLQKQNTILVSLDLGGNNITDIGAKAVAKGLRMNRALLSISLACNYIGDKGAIELAQVISQFPLTHVEVVQRRRLLMEDRANKTPTPTGGKDRSYSKDRPTSVESGGKDKKDKKSAKSKRAADKPAEDTSKKGSKATAGGKGKVSVVTTEVKVKATPGPKGTKRDKKGTDDDNHDIPEVVHPLLESIERRGDEIWVLGNRVLLNLNLARNKIGEAGLKAILEAVLYQLSDADGKCGPGYGLIRLCVQRNQISADHDLNAKIDDAMASRNPFQKPPTPSPTEDQL